MAPFDFPAGGYTKDYLRFWALWVVVVVLTIVYVRSRRGRPGLRALVAGNALVLLSLLWTAVVAGETYLRYVYDGTDSYGLTLTNFSWFRRHMILNSDGFRDVQFAPGPPPPGVTRVACVGDSFTMGYGVPDAAEAWPQRVGAALDPARFEVRNLGVTGFDTDQEIDLVRDLLRAGGRHRVVLGYCLNDADDLLPPGRRFDRGAAERVPWIPPTSSFVADFLWFRLKLRGDPRVRGYFDWVEAAYADPSILARQELRFRKMKAVCDAAGARLDVIVFPFFATWGDGYRFDACHDAVLAAWRRAGVEAIDLREAYRGIDGAELVVSRIDSHPNSRAQEIAARVVLERVIRR